MTAREWRYWLTALLLTVLLHAALPRYEWLIVGGIPWRVDRWSGTLRPPTGGVWPR